MNYLYILYLSLEKTIIRRYPRQSTHVGYSVWDGISVRDIYIMWAWDTCGGQVSGCSVTIVPGELSWCRPVPLVLSSIGGGFLFPRAPGLLLNVSPDSLCD